MIFDFINFDYFNLATGHLKRKKLRSTLTVIGIFISIATIFVLISLSLGLNNAINEQFQKLGSNKFFIQPKGQAGPPGAGGAIQLTTKDVEIIEKTKGVEDATYFTVGNAKIEFKGNPRYYMLMGMPVDSKKIALLFESMGIGVESGRFLRQGDKRKVLVGYNYMHGNLFDTPLRINDKLKLNGVEFDVVGILDAVGNPQDDQQVYITQEDFKELFNSGDRVDAIFAETKPQEDINVIAQRAKKNLMRSRDVTEKTIDFEVSTPEELLASFGTILNIITVFLLGVAGISLVVGGIGIANTMYTSVLERTKEIGTMKAIGAKNRDILKIFVIESGFLGIIGGVLGVIFGILIGKMIDFIAINFLKTNLLRSATPLWLILGCLLFAFLIGSISGFLPARQASKIRPADTLRYE